MKTENRPLPNPYQAFYITALYKEFVYGVDTVYFNGMAGEILQ